MPYSVPVVSRRSRRSSFPGVPIITEGQQQFRWSKTNRPIVQLFHRMTYLDRTVSVQILSRSLKGDSFEARTLGAVQQRFLSKGTQSIHGKFSIFRARYHHRSCRTF